MSTFLDIQLVQLHALIASNLRSEQAVLTVFADIHRAIGTNCGQRARDSLAQAYAISLCYVLLPSQASNIADQWTSNDGINR
jgi:hypothetical protein